MIIFIGMGLIYLFHDEGSNIKPAVMNMTIELKKHMNTSIAVFNNVEMDNLPRRNKKWIECFKKALVPQHDHLKQFQEYLFCG